MKRLVATFAAVANLVLADAVTKELACGLLKGRGPVELLSVFNLAYVENRGCAWGMFQGAVWPLAAFGLVALAFLVWKRRYVFGDAFFAPCLLYAGIVGNVIDRLFRGFVVDMLDFHWGASHFPCFNLADSYICIAVGLMMLDAARPSRRAAAKAAEGGGKGESAR